jgi:hypothetical protein
LIVHFNTKVRHHQDFYEIQQKLVIKLHNLYQAYFRHNFFTLKTPQNI